MRSMLAVATGVLVAGCASGSSGAAPPVADPIPHVTVSGSSVDYSVHPDVHASDAREVPAPISMAWAALPDVYKKLGLAITAYDATSHTIVGERLRSRRPFGTRPLRTLLDCGDVAGVPAIDHDEVNLQVRTTVRDVGSTTDVSSIATASAQPDGTSGSLSPCFVNAGIADEIANALVAAVKH